MTWIDWLIVLVLNGGVMVYGLILAQGRKTSQDWFLGGRSLSWWAIGMSMFATNVDNADLVSLTGTTYREGIHIIMVHTLGTLLGACFAAFYLVPTMTRAGQFTNAEYLESRFGPTPRVLSALIQIQYRSSMLGLMIWSLYLLLTTLLGLERSTAWVVIVTIVVFAGIYTSLGGLKSVVMTDAYQGMITLVAMGLIFWAVWNAVGGWTPMRLALAQQPLDSSRSASDLLHVGRYYGDHHETSPWVVAVGWIIIGCGYWTVNHTQTMRLSGARSIWDMKMAAIFGATISMPVMVGCALLGLFGRVLYPDFEAPDQLYPLMADRYLVVGCKGIVIAGMIAAAVSTFDSMGSSLSALFTRDIYARFVAKDRDDAHYVRVSRWATVGILTSGFAYLPFISSKDTMLQAFLTLIPVFVTPLLTIYVIGIFTRAHERSGALGITMGACYGVLALIDREVVDLGWLPTWLSDRWAALLWAVAATSCGAMLATIIWGRSQPHSRPRQETGWLFDSSHALRQLPEMREGQTCAGQKYPEYLAVTLIAIIAFAVFFLFW